MRNKKTTIDIAVQKMLDMLGLHIVKKRINRIIPLVSESMPGKVRVFKDNDGNVLSITINPSNCQRYENVFPCEGLWSFFKDSNQATFDVLTKSIRTYVLPDIWHKKVNPFFGCHSPEEVMMKCDLLAK